MPQRKRRRPPWTLAASVYCCCCSAALDGGARGDDGIPPTLIVGSFLGTFPRMHRAAMNEWKNVYVPNPNGDDAMGMIEPLINSVAALRAVSAAPLDLVIVTDVAGLTEHARARGNDFEVHVPSNLSHYRDAWGFLGANDVRFVMQRDFLLERSSPCTFLVDSSDILVLRHPGELCAGHPSGTLALGTDSAGARFSDAATHGGLYMRKVIARTHYGEGDAVFAGVMADPTLPLLNCGIVGGGAAAMSEFFRQAGEILWARRGFALTRPVDMILVNHIGHSWEGEVVLGYPFGDVNLPFKHRCDGVEPPCVYEELEATGRFFFKHK